VGDLADRWNEAVTDHLLIDCLIVCAVVAVLYLFVE